MSGLFIKILNMSISASFVALVVMMIRLLIKKAPKKYSYALWAVVFFRFVCPFTIELPVSAVPVKPQTIPQDIAYSENSFIQSVPAIDNAVNNVIAEQPPSDAPVRNTNTIQVVLWIGAAVWLTGILVLLLHGIYSYLRLYKKVYTAIRVQGNIYETDRIKTPFVLGFIHPKIYVPIGLSEQELLYATLHEQTHIKRWDYLIKPFAFLITSIYWFNPLAWAAYALMTRDMELSADDNVIKSSNADIRGEYSNTLLTLSAKKSGLLSPLAFAETGVSTRVKNVMKYKKPALLISVVTIGIVITASVLLLGSTPGKVNDMERYIEASGQAVSDSILVVYIDENYSVNDARELQSQIRENPNVDKVTFVSSQQAFDEFKRLAEDAGRFEEVDEDESYFRNRYIVNIIDDALWEQTSNSLASIEGVVRIRHTQGDGSLASEITDFQRQQEESIRNTLALIREIALKSDKIQECVLSWETAADNSLLALNIMVTIKNDDMLSESDVVDIHKVIENLIPGIDSESITITDNNQNVYSVMSYSYGIEDNSIAIIEITSAAPEPQPSNRPSLFPALEDEFYVTPVNEPSNSPHSPMPSSKSIDIQSLSITYNGKAISDITLFVGERIPLQIQTEPADLNSNERVTWSSSDWTIFEVYPTGPEGTEAGVTGMRNIGTAILTVTVGRIETECIVRVRYPGTDIDTSR